MRQLTWNDVIIASITRDERDCRIVPTPGIHFRDVYNAHKLRTVNADLQITSYYTRRLFLLFNFITDEHVVHWHKITELFEASDVLEFSVELWAAMILKNSTYYLPMNRRCQADTIKLTYDVRFVRFCWLIAVCRCWPAQKRAFKIAERSASETRLWQHWDQSSTRDDVTFASAELLYIVILMRSGLKLLDG